MSIEVNEITKLYGSQKALNNISFQIDAGEIVGFLGPNGAGKSTMMKILTCYIPPSSGMAKVCGFDVQDEFGEVKKRVGYLPETNPLYLDMYVKEYLEFVAGIHQLGAKSKSRISEMIALTGLEIERNKKIGQLSKGYKAARWTGGRPDAQSGSADTRRAYLGPRSQPVGRNQGTDTGKR
jgi:ABC-2 type transport system ATP-binding protein